MSAPPGSFPPPLAGGLPGPPPQFPQPPQPPQKRTVPAAVVVAILAVIGAVVVVVVALGTGGDDDGGTGLTPGPTSEPTPDATGDPQEQASPSTTDGDVSSLADLEPCSLLTEDEAASLGTSAGPGEEDDVGSARTCSWRVEQVTGPNVTDAATLSVRLWDTAGPQDLAVPPGTEVSPLPPIGAHEAEQQWEVNYNTCTIVLMVSDSSHAHVAATGDPEGDLCAVANETAAMVEPRLP